MIPKCPACSAPIYSRTSGICPECRSPLPGGLLLSEEEKRNRSIENEKLKQMVSEMQDKSKKKGVLKRFLQ
ncbi:MAG: hypothetical protein JW768_06955 [Chitinispirillaceae bacterium]|nr:hypothetical protein [Chitinispirillaceae bacterium]